MKYLKYFENKNKGSDIIYTFKTKAISHGNKEDYTYNVHILKGDTKYPDKFGNFVLSIESTPGSWYVSTLMDSGSFYRNTAVIDGGQNWTVDNWDEVSKEFFEILPKLEMMVQADKYNL